MKNLFLLTLLILTTGVVAAQSREAYPRLTKDDIGSVIAGVEIRNGKLWALNGYTFTIKLGNRIAVFGKEGTTIGGSVPTTTFSTSCTAIKIGCTFKAQGKSLQSLDTGCTGFCTVLVVHEGKTYIVIIN